MNTIAGMHASGFNPTPVLEKITERFQATDVDNSGTLTKAELTEAGAAKGMDTSKIDKLFAWLDIDGDSVVTQQEHEDRLLSIAQRLGNSSRPDNSMVDGKSHSEHHPRLGGHSRLADYAQLGDRSGKDGSAPREIFGALKTLSERIDASSASTEQRQQLQDLSRKIETEGFSEDNLSALISFLTVMVPPINSTV